ncbi:MAG TPA: hypothetical protein VG897_00385, partial [Terriglobales bacterium]|nr:hypothetical protein [Terriglobales bacterium]
ITGKFATALYGSDSVGAAAFGAQFRLDGVGAVSAEVDSNLNGNVVSNVTMSGSYNVTDTNTGRTELTLNGNGKTYSFVAYPASGQDLYLAETDGPVAAGQAFAQQGFVITTGSLAGSFATSLSGNTLDNPQQFESATGQLVINGGGAITGTIDIISGGAVTSASALTASYFVDGSGYVTVTYQDSASALSSGTLALYPIDAQRFLSIEIDGNRVLTGFSEIHN